MKNTDYGAINALNWSTLKHVVTSPRMLRYRETHPEPPKRAYRLGTAIHCAVLEPERFSRDYYAEPHFGDGRTRAAKEARAQWRLDHTGDPMSQSDHELCSLCAGAVREHTAASALLSRGKAEVTITWENSGMSCKGRVDWLSDMVVDLKTTRASDVRSFARDCARYLYHGQIAWYHYGAIAAGALPASAKMPRIIAVQTVAPYDVWVLRVASLELDAGRRVCERAMLTYLGCSAENNWPGILPSEADLELPRYAPGMCSDDDEDWP